MRIVLIYSIRFILLVALQVFVFNQMEVGLGIYPMVYPLFIMLLPFSTPPLLLLLLAFLMGFTIDVLSNTGGLHASSLLVFALFRPIVFKLFSPRDGYEGMKDSSIYGMGQRWFLYTFGMLLLVHHFWFFSLEIFRFSEIFYILRKLFLSAPISYLLVILLQFLFLKKKETR